MVREKPKRFIHNSFESDFDRTAVPREISQSDKCMFYLDQESDDDDKESSFPMLTLDLGQKHDIDAI